MTMHGMMHGTMHPSGHHAHTQALVCAETVRCVARPWWYVQVVDWWYESHCDMYMCVSLIAVPHAATRQLASICHSIC